MNENEKTLRVLVLEDKEIHQKATIEQLSGLELEIVDNFQDFTKKINGNYKPPKDEPWKKFPEKPLYNAVLTDMNFTQNGSGKEAPLGYNVMMYASLAKIPMVGIYTDNNHHNGPLSATSSAVRSTEYYTAYPVYQVNETRFTYFDADSFHTRDKPKRGDNVLKSLIDGKRSREPWKNEE